MGGSTVALDIKNVFNIATHTTIVREFVGRNILKYLISMLSNLQKRVVTFGKNENCLLYTSRCV